MYFSILNICLLSLPHLLLNEAFSFSFDPVPLRSTPIIRIGCKSQPRYQRAIATTLRSTETDVMAPLSKRLKELDDDIGGLIQRSHNQNNATETISSPSSSASKLAETIKKLEIRAAVSTTRGRETRGLSNKKKSLLTGDKVLEIKDRHDLDSFLSANPEKLLILKFYAPYCKSCRALAPLYKLLAHDTIYAQLPIVFGEINSRPNMEFFREVGIKALPTVSVYRGGTSMGAEGLIHRQRCGPAKFKSFKLRLEDIVGEVFPEELASARRLRERERAVEGGDGGVDTSRIIDSVEDENVSFLKDNVPLFRHLSRGDISKILDSSSVRLETFTPNSVVLRHDDNNELSRTNKDDLYVIKSGTVQIKTRHGFEDPLTTPSSYPGVTVNSLSKGDYFAEWEMQTGASSALSLVAENTVQCLVFSDNGSSNNASTENVNFLPDCAVANDCATEEQKYGYGANCDEECILELINRQIVAANMASQKRGSVNHPKTMRGIDTDEVFESEEEVLKAIEDAEWNTIEGSVFPPPINF